MTLANRADYCDRVLRARLDEWDEQLRAVSAGLAEVCPAQGLLLLSAPQLEELVCGAATLDMEA